MSENAAAEQMEMPKHGEFCWTEIVTKDLAACQKFYTEIFGWELKRSEATGEDMTYLEYAVPGKYPMGGIFEMSEECEAQIPVPHFMNYIAVTDVDETTRQALELGGKIVVPPTDIPNVGRFSMLEDPTGGTFSVLTLKQ